MLTSDDTVDKVDIDLLERVSAAFADMMERIDTLPMSLPQLRLPGKRRGH